MSKSAPPSRARLLFHPDELQYDFGADHPFQARRILALMDLLKRSGLWQSDDEHTHLPLRAATLEELSLVHTPDYIAAVQRLSMPTDDLLGQHTYQDREALAEHYGFGDADTPPLPGMHEAAARIAGGTLVSLSAVMGLPAGGTFTSEEERPLHVFHPAGGLHHAWAERASGFCIYNDIAVAIAHLLRASEAKVLYIDFDAHHGDGVQRAFYDDPRVMTVSLHETGRYLFPGTGEVLELGNGSGRGYSVNVPLEAFTEDDSYIEVMNSLFPPLVLSFAPDVIVSLHGCDTHAWDPLTHLELTLRGIQAQIRLAHRLAHTYCQGRWVALGGGGYDLYRVVPRAWSMVWAEMSEQPVPTTLPEEWVQRWYPAWQAVAQQEEAEQEAMGKTLPPARFPTTFEDQPEDFPAQPRRWTISHANQRTTALVRHLLLPPPVRHAFRSAQRPSPTSGIFDLLHVREAAPPSRTKTLPTPKGTLLLRDFCPPSLVERLKADSGLHAFARLPEREHELLLTIARSPDCALTLAHTPTGEIVGEVTLAPGDDWFAGIEDAYEVTIEVSSNWRGAGVAQRLLAFALELDTREEMILFAMGLAWHWDLEGMQVSLHRYREMIARLFATQGFTEYATTEPNISMEPGNILLARVGKHVDPYVVNRFLTRLGSSSQIPRL
jgi:acetoin utilization deacetylase AcuC-like enzyme/GNAT superfamily N-acetyltransferase